MDVDETLRATLETFREVRMAVLFGSTARGKATPKSDLDVGVLLDDDAPKSTWDIELALAGALRPPVDLIDLRSAPPLLRFEISREGRVLFEREEGLWPGFKARAMLDWWDWAPTARMIHNTSIARLRSRLAHGEA